MKLLNQSIKYISVSLLFIVSLWAVIFYFSMLNEIKESVDEELENYKRQIVYKVQKDTSILSQSSFDEGFFAIQPITQTEALAAKDRYIDTMMYMQDADDPELELEPVRMLATVFEHENKYYHLSIINSMVEEDDLIEELFRDTIWLYIILIIGIIFINNVILQRLWKPFYDLLYQLKNFRLGSNTPLPQVSTQTKEFNDLQQALNTLLQHNIETYEQQKEFIGNASHELQTPLAIAISKLELLIEKGNLDQTQTENIADILHIIERLVRLNKSLLLLTKIENKQFLQEQKISFNQLFRQSISDMEDITDYKNIHIQLNESAELSAQMDKSLANIIISNLLRNAVFHNIPNGTVNINISEKSVVISNSGKNTPLDPNKIFTRFYKSDSETSGSGLGLAIIKAIGDLYGFTVSYKHENDLHQFTLKF